MHRLILFLSFLCAAGSIFADEDSDFVTLPTGAVYPGDYYVAAENIELLGTVEGDAYIAGMQVYIDGEIYGDLLLAAASATISGKVHGNVRFIGGQVMINGEIDKNVSVVAGSLQLEPASVIHGNLTAVVGTLDLSSTVDGTASIAASNIRVAGHVGKTLDAVAGRLRLTAHAVIGGNLDYRGNEKATIDPAAIIRGKFIQHPGLFKGLQGSFLKGFIQGSKILALLMNFLFTLIVGIFIMRIFPKNIKHAHEVLTSQPLKALGMGVVLLIALPLTSILLLMTILGAPFAVALLAINIVSFYTAKIFSITWASNFLAKKTHMRTGPIATFAIGLVIYYGLTKIPVVGIFIALAALLFGLGAALLGRTRRHIFEKFIESR